MTETSPIAIEARLQIVMDILRTTRSLADDAIIEREVHAAMSKIGSALARCRTLLT